MVFGTRTRECTSYESLSCFDAELNSIKFAHGKDHQCVKVKTWWFRSAAMETR